MEHVSASQVGHGSVGSLTKAPSELPVNTVEAAVLKSLHCRMSNWRCKTPRRLCSGSRDSLWKKS